MRWNCIYRIAVLGFFVLVLQSCLKDTSPPSFEEQLQRDIEIIDEYLNDRGIIAEVDPSGLRYIIHTSGSGNQPELQKCVTFSYEGKLLSTEEIFDSGENTKLPLYFLIDGFKIGLPLIAEGGEITLYIPSVYGYGRSGNPPQVPSNANLIFDVSLSSVSTINHDTGLCN